LLDINNFCFALLPIFGPLVVFSKVALNSYQAPLLLMASINPLVLPSLTEIYRTILICCLTHYLFPLTGCLLDFEFNLFYMWPVVQGELLSESQLNDDAF